MKIIQETQGSEGWHRARAKHHCASDAPAVMGCSKFKTRNDLLKEKATGITEEITAEKQRLFDRGHEAEDHARSLVEEMIGDELFPIVATDDKGYLLASFDGMTMDSGIGYEHKLYSDTLAEQVKRGELGPAYYWQLEQQLLVGGLEKIIFVTSDCTKDRFASMEYRAVPGRAEQLLAAWKQLDADLDAYQVVEVKPAAVAATIKQLPALMVNLVGEVTSTNLAVYEETALSFIKAINTDLRTDQDFADAEAMLKFCDGAEKELETVKKMALAQTSTIDELFRTIDGLKEQMRSKRLELDKLVKSRKDTIKQEIIQRGQRTVTEHIANMNTRLGKPYMPFVTADFIGVTKGKRTVDSFNEAVDLEIARVKIAANEIADKIDLNLKTLKEKADGYQALFADAGTLVLKAKDDLIAVIESRIAKHEQEQAAKIAAEAKRLADEAERQRVAAEVKAQQEELLRIAAEVKANAIAMTPPMQVIAPTPSPAPAVHAINAPQVTQRPPVVTPLPTMTCDMLISRITARLKTLSVSELAEVDAFIQAIQAELAS